ncbi:SDR family NAD(P)-dependent oxidoreductase [Actinomadura sp. NPDC047616]|uniref:SDR family NAD(P)-dependent oxidoreductase n=1 Tax=Actinomadura sp. NPDC047616 TaxID=3155914 RepID=UPI0033EA370C
MATILITGATAGVGRYLTRRLAGRGETVLAHGRDAAKLDALVKELDGAPGRVRPYVADLASLAEVRDLAGRVAADHDRLDVLVNNAGVGSGRPEGRTLTRDGHELRFAVNYLAPVLLTRLLLPRLRAAAPARVVNEGSLGQEEIDFADLTMARRYSGTLAYCRSKLALAAWSFDLADELRADRIAVNCIHPATYMDTDMVRDAGVAPWSTVEDGGEAVLQLIDAPPDVTGEFFDGARRSRAHDAAYDPGVRSRLRAATAAALE